MAVAVQPYLGAEKEGVLGFGKGMVKGVVGVAIKVRVTLQVRFDPCVSNAGCLLGVGGEGGGGE